MYGLQESTLSMRTNSKRKKVQRRAERKQKVKKKSLFQVE